MRTTVQVGDAPAAIGPYAQAQVIRLHGGNRMVFTSGQIARVSVHRDSCNESCTYFGPQG